MHAPTDTPRRARLRSRGSIGRWRIESASWVGWLFAVNALVGLLVGVATRTAPGLLVAAVTIGITAAMVYGIHRMRQGSRTAACVVLGAALLISLARGIAELDVFDAIVIALLANGAWGVFQLARVRRDAEHVPPAPVTRAVRSH